MIDDSDLVKVLRAWDVGAGVSIRRYGRGMNSTTWLVSTDANSWIAKAVPASSAPQFDAGLAAAARLDKAGIPAGAPLPTMAGAFSVTFSGACLALLHFVEGRELDPTRPDEQRVWGTTLGQAHRILLTKVPPPNVQAWHWVDADAPHLDVEPWVRPAVLAAVDELADVQRRVLLTIGLLHADPAPEVFLIDTRGQAALIDLSSVTWGPLLYDLASARMYAGDEATFTNVRDSYLAVAPIQLEEIAALPTFLRFRWAVQADYFARRIHDHDLTGIDDANDNVQGLEDARRYLSTC